VNVMLPTLRITQIGGKVSVEDDTKSLQRDIDRLGEWTKT